MKNIILFLLALTGCVAQSREVGTLNNRDIVTTLTELTNTVDSIQGNISNLESSVDAKLDLKQDKLNPSNTISISNNTVSVITSVPSPTIEKGRVADAYYTYQQMRNSAIDSFNALLTAREANSKTDSTSNRVEEVNVELKGLVNDNRTLILDSAESLSNKIEESFVSTSNRVYDVDNELRELIANNSSAISNTSESLYGSISSLSNAAYNAIANVENDISIQIQAHNVAEDSHENRFAKQMEMVESNYVQKTSMPDYLKDYVKFDEISGEIDLSDYVTSNQLASAISNVQTKIEFNDTISESNGVYGVNLYKITGLTVPNYGYVADAKSAQDYANLLFSGLSEIYVKKSAYNLFYNDTHQRLFTLERDLPLLENRVDTLENKESIVVIPDAYISYGWAADAKYVYDNFVTLWDSTNTLNQATKTLRLSYNSLDNRIDGIRDELEEKADKGDIRAYNNLVYMKQLVTNATWTINLEVVHDSGVFITSENANLVLMETFDATIGNPTTSNNLREEVIEVWQGMSDKSGYFCQLEYILIGRNTGIENRKFRLTVNSDFVFTFKLSELISADAFPSSFEISGSTYTDVNNSYRITTTGTLNNNAPVTMPLACRFALETPFLSLDTLNSNKADKVDVPTFARLEERLTQFYTNIIAEVNTALNNKVQSVYDGMIGTIILCPYVNVEDLPYRTLKCDGTMYNKNDDGGKYLKLFNKIGTFYGGNESSGDFQVPNIAPLTSKATITSSSGSYEYTFDYYYYIIY